MKVTRHAVGTEIRPPVESAELAELRVDGAVHGLEVVAVWSWYEDPIPAPVPLSVECVEAVDCNKAYTVLMDYVTTWNEARKHPMAFEERLIVAWQELCVNIGVKRAEVWRALMASLRTSGFVDMAPQVAAWLAGLPLK